MKAETARKWIHESARQIEANKEQLTQLDQTLGDGDHGLNMGRGFQAAVEQLDQDTSDVGKVLKGAGTSLLSKIGGASGPLYGTFFMKLGAHLAGEENPDLKQLTEGFRSAVDSMKKRGKAEAGEKTMIDVFEPVTEFLETENVSNLDNLREKAEASLEEVQGFEAKKGRAAYYKEKSVGKQDAGAQSAYYILSSLVTVLKEEQ
ncbi:dihydroxyacetone kinase subunit L [Halobacillus salinarum]|uniref:Dihydroxyacetone kinase subunit L n=1 Tax=Halobacillus salinarum TaxID=2932257 RepID=A0ABY4EIL8_9BACI|nr:dihydroxyacetone kinase subunit DhaL [Halobacillus salinarum]UOQ43984.1 dihydroxyacetone kinase subunit L [Halobacillus salinarum]